MIVHEVAWAPETNYVLFLLSNFGTNMKLSDQINCIVVTFPSVFNQTDYFFITHLPRSIRKNRKYVQDLYFWAFVYYSEFSFLGNVA